MEINKKYGYCKGINIIMQIKQAPNQLIIIAPIFAFEDHSGKETNALKQDTVDRINIISKHTIVHIICIAHFFKYIFCYYIIQILRLS